MAVRQPTDVASLFGQPGKTQWTPLELVQKSAGLPGVSGALIALSDGLLVASQMPPNFNGEMVAAFLPQMFGRMSHYTRELKLGEPNSLMLTVDRQPLQIFKVGNVYFLAVGQSGENMPIPQLEAVAHQLERQSQPT
jgi:predicted regulator of Ras-like GTPase activity (Roadblock/LC7/MglB family)